MRPSRYDREEKFGSTEIIANFMVGLLALVLAIWFIAKFLKGM